MSPHVTEAQGGVARGRLDAARALAGSDTGRAAGMAVAVGFQNILALVFTVIFARELGADGYGSLAVLVSAYIVLMVGGQALQIATAREVSHAIADGAADPCRGVRGWLRHLLVATVVVAVVSVPLQSVIASVLAVGEHGWAAAAVPVTGMAFAVVCVERGALQAMQHYRIVGSSLAGEALLRLAFALVLVGAGLGVTGAFLGQALALAGVGAVLWMRLARELPHADRDRGGLRELLASSWAPVIGLTLLFCLQEVHVIVVKHVASDDAAGSYAVAAVAAKAVIWIAVGLGMYLLPEASRRARSGEDARRVLASTLGLIALVAVPMVALYATAGEPILRAAFGDDLTGGRDALPWLGVAMSLLACSYLCVQYLLALGRRSFIPVLLVGVVADVVLLASIGDDLTGVAVALACLQGACAVTLMAICARTREPVAHPGDELLAL